MNTGQLWITAGILPTDSPFLLRSALMLARIERSFWLGSLSKMIGMGLRGIGVCACLWFSILAASAQGNYRNFRMGLWNNPAGVDSDIPFFAEGQIQPHGHSVLILTSWRQNQFADYWTQTLARQYDFARIKAVLIDEPYWTALGTIDWSNPCRNTARKAVVDDAMLRLSTVAGIVKSSVPRVRFWINFSEPEMTWMMDTECPLALYQDYIDVVSVDVYWRPFSPTIKLYYSWLLEHRSQRGQQIALTPGTFYRGGVDNPIRQASFLKEFFDYATRLNQSCDPQKDGPADDSAQDCVVWIVAGWLAQTHSVGTVVWHGEHDPASLAIRSAWHQEFRKPIRRTRPSSDE